jgi:hypothetical protein
MHIFYADESYDQTTFVLTALCVEDASWRAAFNATKEFRSTLKTRYGIKIRAELHAHSFVRKVDDGISTQVLSQARRRQIYAEVLAHVAGLPLMIFNIVMNVRRWGSHQRAHEIAVERLANRVQRTMRALGSHAVVIFDKGKETEITKIIRRQNVFNQIPSAFGTWPEGATRRNIVLDRFIDDPFFKDSRRSYFLQLADFVAFALLKSEVQPTGFVASLRYNEVFDIVDRVCFRPASARDPRGIVRG